MFTFLLIFLHIYSAIAQGNPVTCDATPVKKGQRAQVTCNFNTDFSTLEDYIATVEYYPVGQSDPVEILQCHKVPGGAPVCGEAVRGYAFEGHISTTLSVDIINASNSNAGRYICKLQSHYLKKESETCTFQMIGAPTPSPKPPQTTTPTEPVTGKNEEQESGFPVIPVAAGAGGVVVLIAVVVVVIICICKRRVQKPLKMSEKEMKEFCRVTNEREDATPARPQAATKAGHGDEEFTPPIPRRSPIPQAKKEAVLWDGQAYDAEALVSPDNAPPKPPRLSLSMPSDKEGGDNTVAEEETKQPLLNSDDGSGEPLAKE